MFIHTSDSGNLTVSHCFDESPKTAVFSKHMHEYHEILLLIKGDINFNIDGKLCALSPFDLLFIPASTYHVAIPATNSPYENYVINLSTAFPSGDYGKQSFQRPHIINIAGSIHFRNLFSLLDYYHETYTDKDFETASDLLINEMLLMSLYLQRDVKETDRLAYGDLDNSIVPKITGYIGDNLSSELNAKAIGKALNYSESYVRNIFYKKMGIGIQSYINKKKILAAHEKIMEGVSSRDASLQFGFSEYSSFYRQYRKVFGVSPKNNKH